MAEQDQAFYLYLFLLATFNLLYGLCSFYLKEVLFVSITHAHFQSFAPFQIREFGQQVNPSAIVCHDSNRRKANVRHTKIVTVSVHFSMVSRCIIPLRVYIEVLHDCLV